MIEKILDIIKLTNQSKRFFVGLFSCTLSCGTITFLPDSLKKIFHLDKLPQEVETYAPGLFLFFSIFAFAIVVQGLHKKVSLHFMKPSPRKSFLRLDNYQKQIIIELLLSEDKSIVLDYSSGVARYLMELNFICRSSQYAPFSLKTNSFHVKYTAQPWLITAFNEDPDFFLRHKIAK